MWHFNDVRYVINTMLHCNLFSLAKSVVNNRQNIKLFVKRLVRGRHTCCFMLVSFLLQKTIAFHTGSLLNQKNKKKIDEALTQVNYVFAAFPTHDI